MSLFNTCIAWSTQTPDLDENYDMASLLCARFGLEEHEKDYIVIGSHAGHLSIFYPNLEFDKNDAGARDDENYFRATDLLLETTLDAPILGVYAGRFSGNNRQENTNQLAILHPYSVVICHIKTMGGVAEHGTQLYMQTLAEYKFERIAFDFCKGHFGKVKGREFFCVVHLDGTLTFYEQDGIAYECQFPGHRSLPAPVVYCERTDSFMRFGAAWNLECFTYQDLSQSQSNNRSQYQPVWSVCLGEGIIDMSVVQMKTESASIMILGERNFMCVTDSGKVDFILKLDYVPKCFNSFVIGYYWEPNARLVTAIVSDNSKLFIYDMANIIWAAQYKESAPVAIQRSNVSGLPGSIVTLGATGKLNIGYLGSDPYVFKVPLHRSEKLTFSEAHKELLQLEDEIKAAVDIQDAVVINRLAKEDVRITLTISSMITEDSDAILLDVPADVALKNLPSCSGTLKFKCKSALNQLQITFNMSEGIRCSQDTVTYVDVAVGTTESLELDFYIADLLHIHSARVTAVISFISTKGIPRVIQESAYLPLCMFYKIHAPQKEAAIKQTFNITTQSLHNPKLSTFFPEFVTWENDMHALGLQLLCPADDRAPEEVITIVAAKNSNRFRIQSDSLETFPMILERLINVAMEHEKTERELNHRNRQKSTNKTKSIMNSRVQCIIANPFIPVQEILHRIDVHHETQDNIRKQTLEMDDLWQQFKMLQRKLQEKSDDEPTEPLVMEIEKNYDHLIAEGDKLMEMRKDERRQRCDLTSAIMVATLIISSLCMEQKIISVITSVLYTPIEDWTDLSWEESMSPGIDMLHHYGPLVRNISTKSINNMAEGQTTSQEQFDYNRFRRHFATLFERIVRIASSHELEANTQYDGNKQFYTEQPANVNKQIDIDGLNQLLVVPATQLPKIGSLINAHNSSQYKRISNSRILEPVVDDEETGAEVKGSEWEEEEEDDDINDLRQIGYRKNYGTMSAKNRQMTEAENSEWINENYELPSSEELFSDLGIWW